MATSSRRRWAPAAVGLAYLTIGVLWITLSDYLLFLFLNSDAAAIARIQVVKGLFFITATAAAIYFLLRHAQDGALSLDDISRRKENDEQLAYLVLRDEMTGFYNRRYLRELLSQARESADSGIGALFIDIDHFKVINTSMGHRGGDQLLTAAGRRIESRIRPDDVLCRYGDDDFVVVLTGEVGRHRLEETGAGILRAFEQPFVIDDREVYISVTIGGSLYPDWAGDIDTLVIQADTAMHRGKARGRNCLVLFERAMAADIHHWATYRNALQSALLRDEISVVFQPQFDFKTGRFTVFEALARWHSPGLGRVPPGVFIPIAESAGLIGRLGNLVMTKAVAELARWRQSGHRDVRVAVNVSARQLHDPEFISSVRAVTRASGVPPESVEIEVTESGVMEDAELGASVLRQLGHLGFHIVIDDFGTEYSSLSYLSRLNAGTLKIDKSFIADVLVDRAHAKIAKAVIALAKSLEMRVVAEGVETAEQLAFVQQNGCDMAQGYYFSKPVPAAKALELLERRDDRQHGRR